MGLDGGTKITRSDVLRRQSSRWAQQDTSRSTRGGSVSQVYQETQIDEQVRRTVLWTTCALSGLPLTTPIVADALGQLSNKQAVLEHLLASKMAAAAAAAAAEVPAAAQPHTQSTPALPAAAAGAVTTLSAHTASSTAAGSIIPYMPSAAAPPKDLAAACLRYENQQRAAAAAAAGSDGTNIPAGTFDHIKSLKDVFVVQLTANPACPGLHAGSAPAASVTAAGQQGPAQGETPSAAAGHMSMLGRPDYSSQDLPSPWMCPITLQPCGGSKQPFMALRPCGHVLSQKALAAITPAGKQKGGKPSIAAAASSSSKQQLQEEVAGDEAEECESQACCPVCEAPFDPLSDQVLINGSQQHMEETCTKLREAAAAKATAKDRKKRKRAAAEAAAGQQQQQQRLALLPSS